MHYTNIMQINRKVVHLSLIFLFAISACSYAGPRQIFVPPASTPLAINTFLPTNQPGFTQEQQFEVSPSPASPQPVIPTDSVTQTATKDQVEPTENPALFWVSAEVPGRIMDWDMLPESVSWVGGLVDDAVVLRLAEHMPVSSVLLKQADYIFALVAPFKTVKDDISMAELTAAWQGYLHNEATLPAQIAMYEGDYHALVTLLGGAPGGDAISETVLILSDDQENIAEYLSSDTWAIIPFERLQPEYKVIAIGGISPLQDDFEQQTYPLRGDYAMYTNELLLQGLSMSAQNAIIEAIPETNRDENRLTTLVMTGVTALVRATAYRMEIYGNTYPGEDIVDWLSSADITHISNEVSFYEDCPYPDPYQESLSFCSRPKYIELLEYVGADVVELTGNHNNDAKNGFGVDVVPNTLAMYAERGMQTFGGGLDLADAMQPALLEHNGNKLAFIGCNAPGPYFAWANENSGGSAPCGDYTWMVDKIQQLANAGYLPIATFQYNEDYSSTASSQMKVHFRLMADAGAVIVNGSQAHTPKEFEFYNGAFIHYGLGNLFFDQMNVVIDGIAYPATRNEFIQRHVIYDGRLISIQLLTAVLEDYARPRPMSPEERQVFLYDIFSVSE